MRKIMNKEYFTVLFSDRENEYMVINNHKQFKEGHTHIRTYEQALYLIDCILKKKIPNKTSKYFLVSLKRLSEDSRYIDRIDAKLNNFGNRQQYYNSNKGVRR